MDGVHDGIYKTHQLGLIYISQWGCQEKGHIPNGLYRCIA